MQFFIRADANPNIGMGHVMRCLSIADALHASNQDVIFILADDAVLPIIKTRGYEAFVLNSDYKDMDSELPSWPKQKPYAIIVDSYFVTHSYLTSLKQRTEAKIIYIDDLASFPYPVDVLIAYNAYADFKTYEKLYSPRKLPCLILGLSYAPLREMFQNVPHREQPEQVKNILISTGGADFLHLAKQFLQYPLSRNYVYHLLIGSLNTDKDEIERLANGKSNVVLHENVSDMRSLIESCDVAISAAGSTLYEICACGVPLITYSVADNQLPGAEAFERLGLAVTVGDLRKEKAPIEKIMAALKSLSNNYEARKTMGGLAQKIIDGRGAERLVSMILEKKLYILYIPKHYGQPSLLPQIIGDFLKKRSKQFTIIVSPGFLGDKSDFISQMSQILNGYVSELELFKGMNGLELLQYNEQCFRDALSVQVTPHTTKKDHRKMIFFNDAAQTEAILIGSSNFSYATYFGKGQGEADVFMFYNEAFSQYCRRAIPDGGAYADCVLSESIAMKRTETPQSYLNSIYDEFRRH